MPPSSGHSSTALPVLLAALLLDLLAFTLILPLFPALLDHFARLQLSGSPDPLFSVLSRSVHSLQSWLAIPSVDRYNNVLFGGILGSLFSLLQFLSSPVFGALSDRHGRKPLLLVSVLGSLFSYSLWACSGGCFSLFLLSRVVGGLSKASVSLAIAVVSDLMPAERRGQGMALVGACFSLAFLVGPSVGALLSLEARRAVVHFNPWPPRLALALTGLEFLLLLGWLPETRGKIAAGEGGKREEKQKEEPLADGQSASGNSRASEGNDDNCSPAPPLALGQLLSPRALFSLGVVPPAVSVRHPAAGGLSLLRAYAHLYFLFLLLFSALEFTLGFLTHLRFQYSSAQQGRLYLFSGLCMLVIQGLIVRRVPSSPQAQTRGALVGLCAIVPAFLLMAVAHCQTLLFAGLFLYSVASATVVPCLTTLFTGLCLPAHRGALVGAFRSLGALARALGPLLGSFLFWLLGPALAYSIGALLLIGPPLWLLRIRPADQEDREEQKTK